MTEPDEPCLVHVIPLHMRALPDVQNDDPAMVYATSAQKQQAMRTNVNLLRREIRRLAEQVAKYPEIRVPQAQAMALLVLELDAGLEAGEKPLPRAWARGQKHREQKP